MPAYCFCVDKRKWRTVHVVVMELVCNGESVVHFKHTVYVENFSYCELLEWFSR